MIIGYPKTVTEFYWDSGLEEEKTMYLLNKFCLLSVGHLFVIILCKLIFFRDDCRLEKGFYDCPHLYHVAFVSKAIAIYI